MRRTSVTRTPVRTSTPTRLKLSSACFCILHTNATGSASHPALRHPALRRGVHARTSTPGPACQLLPDATNPAARSLLVKRRQDGALRVEQRDAHIRHQLGILLLQILPQKVAHSAGKLHACGPRRQSQRIGEKQQTESLQTLSAAAAAAAAATGSGRRQAAVQTAAGPARTCGPAAHHHKVKRGRHLPLLAPRQCGQLKLRLDALPEPHAVGDLQ